MDQSVLLLNDFNMVGKSKAMNEVFELIRLVAPTRSTVLIQGESGTGKELVAQAIHNSSNRRRKKMICINCAAIPKDLLEDELFGHEKGAFTNAVNRKPGKFELADEGTLLLDEIGDMPMDLQVKLLRILQDQEIFRIGGTTPRKVDVRVIAATNSNLEKLVAENKFRRDLYYRLNVITVRVPALRERKEDIPVLSRFFLEKICRQNDIMNKTLSDDFLREALNYDWPGNVRELENAVERAAVLSGCKEDLTSAYLTSGEDKNNSDLWNTSHPLSAIPGSGICLKSLVTEYEKKLIVQALKKSRGKKNRAARLLNVKRTTLVEKIKRLNLNPEISVNV